MFWAKSTTQQQFGVRHQWFDPSAERSKGNRRFFGQTGTWKILFCFLMKISESFQNATRWKTNKMQAYIFLNRNFPSESRGKWWFLIHGALWGIDPSLERTKGKRRFLIILLHAVREGYYHRVFREAWHQKPATNIGKRFVLGWNRGFAFRKK